MIIYTTNIFNVPLLLLLWIIDCYLFLAVVRLLLHGRKEPKLVATCSALRTVTDYLPHAVHGWMSSRWIRPPPSWLSWLLVISAAIIVRHLLAGLIIAIL